MRSSLAALTLALALTGAAPAAQYPIRMRPDTGGDPFITSRPSRRSGYGSAKRKARNRVRNRIARQSRRVNRK